ncbi:hypothetical protein GCM10010353_71310 [Streptomyces chryseus]|nr:hypothetical protein GCM10010353_71310 [Streptomyces chryseus]
MRRVTQYQTAGVNARLKVFALLEAQGVASEADDLVVALEARAVAGGTERGGRAERVGAGLRVRGTRTAGTRA